MNVVKKYMLEIGYTKEEIEKIINTYPLYTLIEYTLLENIKNIFEVLLNLGYTRKEIIRMTKSHPQIYGYSIDNIKQKINDIMSLGYIKEEVIKMTKSLPPIYGSSIDNIKQKIEYYDSINLHKIAIVTPKNLIQSVELSYARYEFYKSKGIIINLENFNKLFISQKQFEKQYGISKKELLEKYNYEEYLKENKICKYQYQY